MNFRLKFVKPVWFDYVLQNVIFPWHQVGCQRHSTPILTEQERSVLGYHIYNFTPILSLF